MQGKFFGKWLFAILLKEGVRLYSNAAHCGHYDLWINISIDCNTKVCVCSPLCRFYSKTMGLKIEHISGYEIFLICLYDH